MNSAIGLIANSSWYLHNFRASTILQLRNDGWSVICFAPDEEYASELESLGADFEVFYLDPLSQNPLTEIRSIFSINCAIKHKVSIVLSFTPKCNFYSSLSARLHGIAHVANVSGLGVGGNSYGFVGRCTSWLNHALSRFASHIFFQNPQDKALFERSYGLREEKSGLLFGSGVNLSEFSYSRPETGSAIRFGFFSRLLFDKGIGLFLDVAKVVTTEFDGVEFVFAGPFDERRSDAMKREQLNEICDDRIRYLGSLRDVREELQNCDCIVLPSYYNEGTPKILLEACAIGRPVITTVNRGCQDVVSDSVNGFLIDPRSRESLYSSIIKFLDLSVEEREAMGRRSRQLAESRFDDKLIIESYRNVVCKLKS